MDDAKVLDEKEIQKEMEKVSGWIRDGDKILKEFNFNSFMDALTFITKLSPFLEAHDHHPDMYWQYKKIRFELQRFDVGGKITDKDFIVAAQIEKIFSQKEDIKNYSGLW